MEISCYRCGKLETGPHVGEMRHNTFQVDHCLYHKNVNHNRSHSSNDCTMAFLGVLNVLKLFWCVCVCACAVYQEVGRDSPVFEDFTAGPPVPHSISHHYARVPVELRVSDVITVRLGRRARLRFWRHTRIHVHVHTYCKKYKQILASSERMNKNPIHSDDC